MKYIVLQVTYNIIIAVMKKYSFLLLLFMLSADVLAQTAYLKTVEETQELSKNVTQLISEKKFNAAAELMKPFRKQKIYVPLINESIKMYFSLYENDNGAPTGFAKINNAIISGYFLKETYLLAYQTSAIRLVYTYYQNSEGWMLYDFTFDSSFESEFISK